jgi:exopolysaccharide production negative regulator
MRTFKLVLAGSIAALFTLGAAVAGEVTFRSPEDAMKQGISAFNGGYYELALPAFEALERSKPEVAHYYMARIYGDNEGAYTNHGEAFAFYKALADELQNVDPDNDELAPIAAKSLTAVSMYLREGIRDAGIPPDPQAADRVLQRAALTFNDEDAQFELAKVLLRGEGPEIKIAGFEDASSKIENGRHWLSRLSRIGHAGAQAFLADLLWRGKFVEKDQISALNLIDVAVANAPPSERVWIEDIYQNIFCNAGEGVRHQATGRVAQWHNLYGRRPEVPDNKNGLDRLSAEPIRTCANGELVRPMGLASPTPPATQISTIPPPDRALGVKAGAAFAPGSGVVSSGSAVPPMGLAGSTSTTR